MESRFGTESLYLHGIMSSPTVMLDAMSLRMSRVPGVGISVELGTSTDFPEFVTFWSFTDFASFSVCGHLVHNTVLSCWPARILGQFGLQKILKEELSLSLARGN